MKTKITSKIAAILLLIVAGSFYSCETSDEPKPNGYESFLFRYLGGGRHYMTMSPNQVVVLVGEGVTDDDIKRFFQENASLQVSGIRTMSGNEFTLIYFHGSNRDAIRQFANRLKPNDTILFIGYVIIDGNGRRTSALTNQINLRLRNENDFPILQEAIASYDIRGVRQCEFDRRFYTLTVNYLSGERALQIANELSRTGLFQFAEPDLILFIQFGI